jgi:hypothetical protein
VKFGTRTTCAEPDQFTLIIRNRNSGFFSNLNLVLNNLNWRLGRDGIGAAMVDWRATADTPQFSYGGEEHENLWLRFFEPLPFEYFPAARRESSRYASPNITSNFAYAAYKLNRRWRQVYHRLYRRYIRIQPSIREGADRIYRSTMTARYCVGVHYRHPAHDSECLYPIPSPEVFIERARRMLPEKGTVAVFLATDLEPVVDAFRSVFGESLVLQPGVRRARSASEKEVHRQGAPDPELAEQVLIDCLLLAKCDAMLHVASNIATAAGYINPRLKMVYCETPTQAIYGYWWSLKTILRRRVRQSARGLRSLGRSRRRS